MSLNELNRWREWAQFVYLGGGPVILTDEVLRNAVCQTHDSDVQDMKMERAYVQGVFLDAGVEVGPDLGEAARAMADLLTEAQQRVETLTAERDSVCSAVYPQWMANGWSVRMVALLAQAHRADSLDRDTEEDQP